VDNSCLFKIVIYLCKVINNEKLNNMETFNNIDDLLNSESFNNFFDVETEKNEIENAGWDYETLNNFGKELSKKIEKK
jgi:hypothetical protein